MYVHMCASRCRVHWMHDCRFRSGRDTCPNRIEVRSQQAARVAITSRIHDVFKAIDTPIPYQYSACACRTSLVLWFSSRKVRSSAQWHGSTPVPAQDVLEVGFLVDVRQHNCGRVAWSPLLPECCAGRLRTTRLTVGLQPKLYLHPLLVLLWTRLLKSAQRTLSSWTRLAR